MVRTFRRSAVIAAPIAALGLVLAIEGTSRQTIEIIAGCLIVLVVAMNRCTAHVIRAAELNREAIERNRHDDDASFDAGFEAGELKGYTEGRRAGRPHPVVVLAERRRAAEN